MYILCYLSASNPNLLCCQLCIPNQTRKIYPFSYGRNFSCHVYLNAGVTQVTREFLKEKT